ncbi:MAG: PH domain-containing protein, partial [Vicinamibacterales bacterium]
MLLLLAAGGAAVAFIELGNAAGRQRLAWLVIAVMLVALALGVGALLRGLRTMRYRLTADVLVIEWMGHQRVLPFTEVLDVTYEPRVPLRLPRWEPFWPGYHVSRVRTPDGTWHTWATQEPRRRVRLTTPRGIIAISPERPVRFLAELERRQRALGIAPGRQLGEPEVHEAESSRVARRTSDGTERVES